MKKQILENIDDPEALERLYRRDRKGFSMDFNEISVGKTTDLVNFWNIRLKESPVAISRPLLFQDLKILGALSLLIALLVKGHLFFSGIQPEDYWGRNLPIIIFSGLSAWFILKGRVEGIKNILLLAIPVVILTLFVNFLPATLTDASTLSLVHVPVFMWFIFGMTWLSLNPRSTKRVSAFIRYCGELFVMFGLLCVAGFLLSGMTMGLFAVIGKDIGQVYMENIGIVGLSIFPIVAAWLIDLYPDITSRVVPVIARIFTPLVFLLLIVYLVAIITLGIDLSKDRDSLIIFNLMLLGVMIIILFSLSEIDSSSNRRYNFILLFLLAALTLVIDVFALGAIVTRLSDGFTPNRTVVLVSNILVLGHLILVLPGLFKAGFQNRSSERVERLILGYLPVYFLYSIVVIFLFPFIFSA